MKKLSLDIPNYEEENDITKRISNIQWNISVNEVKTIKRFYEKLIKEFKKRKQESKFIGNVKKLKKEENLD